MFNPDAAMSQLKAALHTIERLKTTKVKAKWTRPENRDKNMAMARRQVKILIRDIKTHRENVRIELWNNGSCV